MASNHLIKKSSKGILLLHGFTANLNEVLGLGEFLGENNFSVLMPVLPGHATHSGDLFNFTWQDWFAHVKESYQELATSCDSVLVCGMSMGGILALHLAAHFPVAGVVTMSAPFDFPKWQKRVAAPLSKTRKFLRKKTGEDVRDVSQKKMLRSYGRYPFYAVKQLFDMVDHVREDLPEVTAPTLLIHSKKDNAVPVENSKKILNKIGSEVKRLILLEESYHIISVDIEFQTVYREVLEFAQQKR